MVATVKVKLLRPVCCLALLLSVASTVSGTRGHSHQNETHLRTLVTIMVDDMGWYDSQINNPLAPTPRIGELLTESLHLDRLYVRAQTDSVVVVFFVCAKELH